MPTYTQNLNLKKPFRGAESIDINIINDNMDIIDEAVGNLEDRSTVITPITTSGTKIAEFEIDGARGALFAPQGQGGGSNVVIEPTLQSGTKIADYTIDDVQGALYIPEPTGHLTDEVYAYDDDHFRAGYGNFDEITADDIDVENGINCSSINIESELNCDTGHFDSIYVDNDELVPVEANPSDTATDTLTSVNIGGTVYDINGGGGGSSVTPNPQGTPTDTLNTVEIDGTIFDIAGSGGGGGSSYTETLLYENTGTSAGDITLSDDLSNYDMLMFVVARTIGVGREIVELPYMTSDLTVGTHITLISYAYEYVNYDVTSMTLLTMTGSQSNYVEKVKGIKFGGGSSSAPHKLYTKLYNGNITSTGDVTLLDSIENYDFILIEIAYLSGEGNPVCGSTIADVAYLKTTYNNTTSVWIDGGNNDRSAKVAFSDATTMKVNKASTSDAIIGVYGLKLEAGGGGGDSNYTEVSLFTGTSRVTNMTLSESIKNFDAIEFQTAWMYNGLSYHISEIITSENLSADNYFIIGTNDYRYVELLVVDNTHINWIGGSDNIMYMKEIKGIKYGSGGGRNSEIIPISAGDGTTSRTFTLERTPKKVTLQGYTSGDGGWYESGYFIWGENFISLIGAQYTVATGGYAGQASITYGADGKSFTITAANAFGAFNRADNFSGMMLVDYGGGSGSSSGGARKDVLYNNPSGAPTATYLALTHDFRDYDEIYMKISNGTDISNFNIYNHVSFMPMMVGTGERVSIQALYGQRVVDVIFDGATFNVIRVDGDYGNTVYEIVGIKY